MTYMVYVTVQSISNIQLKLTRLIIIIMTKKSIWTNPKDQMQPLKPGLVHMVLGSNLWPQSQGKMQSNGLPTLLLLFLLLLYLRI